MPISKAQFRSLAVVAAVAVTALLQHAAMAPADAFEGGTPREAFRSGYAAYKNGDTETAIDALNYAAQNGHAAALWQLGRMYANGDGVQKDEAKALQIYSQIANEHADDNPRSPDSQFVSDAFVSLGRFYREGLGGVEVNQNRARRFYSYAASYFGNADAQYRLAFMYMNGEGGDANPRHAARWFKLAAQKGHPRAQAEFGRLLFDGIGLRRNPVRGLMWLSVARHNRIDDPEIQTLHEHALALASESERRTAAALTEEWLNGQQ